MRDYRWGIFLNPGDAEPQDPLRRPQGRARLAGRARRAPRQPAPHHRHAGRHRAGLGRAAAPPGPHRAQHVRPAQPVPDQRRGRPPPVGDGLPAAQALRPRRPRRGRGAACSAARGDEDNPRILGAFNEKTPDWLAFFMFTYFTDRDGKFQLSALAESAFDPLARTTKFMLTEEAHHMFVGESGVSRVLQRTAQVMNELKTDDPQKVRAAGAIDLPHDPALPQLPLQRDHRPVRRRPVEQRRHLLQLGPQGPLRRRQARATTTCSRARPTRCSKW